MTKCDETLQNNHLLRIHMRKHVRKESQILKCINCEYETTEENDYLNHIVDTHSTVHICQTCSNRFTTKTELIVHMESDHGLKLNKEPEVSEQEKGNTIKCYNCGTMLESRDALMIHKRTQHWKEKKCAYFHGRGAGCRFPDHLCFNIHRMEEQQQFRGPAQGAVGQVQGAGGQIQGTGGQGQGAGGQVQGAGGQGQGAGGQGQGAGGQGQGAGGQGQGAAGQGQGAGGQGQGAGGQRHGAGGLVPGAGGQGHRAGVRYSWAGVARGQSQGYDARRFIDCRDELQCRYYQQGGCRYRHTSTKNTDYQNVHSLQINENTHSESSFNMQEMKLTLENLTKVVYNLKSLADFPRVQEKAINQ